MKIATFLLLLIFAVSCTSKSKDSRSTKQVKHHEQAVKSETTDLTSEQESPAFYDYYVGTLGEFGDGIIVEIRAENGAITGGYWYVKHGKKLTLTGTITPKSNRWKITESYNNKTTGNFDLIAKNDSLIGSWQSPDGSRKEDLVLKRVLKETELHSPRFEKYEMKHLITIYDGARDTPEEATDYLHLGIIDDVVLFNYWVIGTNAHIGNLSGIARKTSPSKATYTETSGCQLAFTFNEGKTIPIEEEGCEAYRGHRAYFGGTLTKVN